MSFTPIAKALALGIAAPQVLDFVSRAFPSLFPKIKKAKDMGYPAEKILSLIDKGMGGNQDLGTMTQQQIHKSQDESQGQLTKDLLKGAGALTASHAALKGIQGLGKSSIGENLISHLGLDSKTSHPGNLTPSESLGQRNLPDENQILGQPQPGKNIQSTSQVPLENSQQPPIQNKAFPSKEFQHNTPIATPKQAKQESTNIIQDLGIEEIVKNVSKSNKNLEQTAQDVLKAMPPGVKAKYERLSKSGDIKPMIGLLRDYMGHGEEAHVVTYFSINEPVKGDIVATPDGKAGELKSVRNGQALIEDEGKLHKVKVEDLIQSPLPEKDLADLYDDVIKGIERETGEQTSRNVEWAGYDEDINELAYKPHLGPLYTYTDISPKEVQMLTSILQKRKTSGKNYIGGWIAGTKSPIGAAISALIQKLQQERGGKGNEYARKFKTVYSAHEPAQLASKNKKKQKKNT